MNYVGTPTEYIIDLEVQGYLNYVGTPTKYIIYLEVQGYLNCSMQTLIDFNVTYFPVGFYFGTFTTGICSNAEW